MLKWYEVGVVGRNGSLTGSSTGGVGRSESTSNWNTIPKKVDGCDFTFGDDSKT